MKYEEWEDDCCVKSNKHNYVVYEIQMFIECDNIFNESTYLNLSCKIALKNGKHYKVFCIKNSRKSYSLPMQFVINNELMNKIIKTINNKIEDEIIYFDELENLVNKCIDNDLVYKGL